MVTTTKNLIRNKFENRLVVEEQRDFTNPHVRFRRIRGKIVPIINRKRIGQDLEAIGNKLVLGGAAAGGISLLKRNKKLKSIFKKAKKPSKFFSSKFSGKDFLKSKVGDSRKVKFAKFSARGSGKAIVKGFKHVGALGAIAAGVGVATSLIGTEFQIRSPFGKDLFFIKDQHGR